LFFCRWGGVHQQRHEGGEKMRDNFAVGDLANYMILTKQWKKERIFFSKLNTQKTIPLKKKEKCLAKNFCGDI